ncbi:hypothetical protein BCR35DRAFT_307917 [Leucosporidium creatinivorum]|uniref:Uncharacterized protein n=1 Tax=Leucosporidium creatinivorum TaxID=106004 RepID=A0A1Y2EGB8_9BASI|nr:hypothetical protein BCR35DRAFT_307917 [Leucosporidium creatinivorum]
MEEEELDPAFLDMPSPSMLSGGFGNELEELELGSGFGSALSDDLGAGFGNPISSSHSDDEHYGHPSTPPSRSRHGSDDALGHDDDGEVAGLTPRRRAAGSGAPSPNSNRLSLAFELASASSPGRSSSRDLLRELGIEEEGASGDEEERYDDEEEEEDLEAEGELEMAGRRAPRRPSESAQLGQQLQDAFAGAGSATPRRIASTSSATYQASTPSVDTPDDEAAQEARDASLSESTSALESSLETTGTFLSHLRQHTTADIDPHAVPSSSSTSPVDPSIPVDYTDRQPVLESLASSVIKSMYDLAKQREGQVRELVEMERIFARNEVGWQAALAQLEELPRDEEDEQSAEAGVDIPQENSLQQPNPSLASTQSLSPSPHSDDLPLPNGDPPSHSIPSSEPTIRPPPPTTASPALAELSSLRDVTSSLVSALSAMNEVSQVTQAATGDAGRKIRALRGQLVATKEDLQGLEKSEEFVVEFEAREERRARIGGRSRAEEVREEMKEAERALEEGWIRAQGLLTVSA